MRSGAYFIPDCPCGRLAIVARPRGGDWLRDEIIAWRSQGLAAIVSMLEDDEVAELGLTDEPAACVDVGLRWDRFPVPDRGVPVSIAQANTKVDSIVSAGLGVGIHCRMGVGRSTLLAACVLVRLGIPVDAAWSAIESARGLSVPDTLQQRDWVRAWHIATNSAS